MMKWHEHIICEKFRLLYGFVYSFIWKQLHRFRKWLKYNQYGVKHYQIRADFFNAHIKDPIGVKIFY